MSPIIKPTRFPVVRPFIPFIAPRVSHNPPGGAWFNPGGGAAFIHERVFRWKT